MPTAKKKFQRAAALAVSAVIFFQQAAFSHALETNLWTERRTAASAASAVRNVSFEVGGRDLAAALQHLPPSIGIVGNENAAFNPESPVVVHIQDVHMNKEAQANVARLIDYLAQEGGVRLVTVEGAFGPVESPRFENIDPAVRRLAADYFLNNLEIGGAVYFSLLNLDPGVKITGVDDKNLFIQNWRAVAHVRNVAVGLSEIIRDREALLNRRKEDVFNAGLLAFDRAARAYRNGDVSLKDHLKTLHQNGSAAQPNLLLYEKASELEPVESVEFKLSRDQFVQKVILASTPSERAELKNAMISVRDGFLSQREFLNRLFLIGKKTGQPVPPPLLRYERYLDISEQINSTALFAEILTAEKSVYRRLAASKKEQILLTESENLALSQKLVDFSLTPNEWKQYQAALTGGDVGRFKTPFERFYSLARKRDRAMADNVAKALTENGARRTVLVAGGFHSAGIHHELKRKGIRVVTISPRFNPVKAVVGSHSLFKSVDVFSKGNTFLTQPVMTPRLYNQILWYVLGLLQPLTPWSAFRFISNRILTPVSQRVWLAFRAFGRSILVVSTADGLFAVHGKGEGKNFEQAATPLITRSSRDVVEEILSRESVLTAMAIFLMKNYGLSIADEKAIPHMEEYIWRHHADELTARHFEDIHFPSFIHRLGLRSVRWIINFAAPRLAGIWLWWNGMRLSKTDLNDLLTKIAVPFHLAYNLMFGPIFGTAISSTFQQFAQGRAHLLGQNQRIPPQTLLRGNHVRAQELMEAAKAAHRLKVGRPSLAQVLTQTAIPAFSEDVNQLILQQAALLENMKRAMGEVEEVEGARAQLKRRERKLPLRWGRPEDPSTLKNKIMSWLLKRGYFFDPNFWKLRSLYPWGLYNISIYFDTDDFMFSMNREATYNEFRRQMRVRFHHEQPEVVTFETKFLFANDDRGKERFDVVTGLAWKVMQGIDDPSVLALPTNHPKYAEHRKFLTSWCNTINAFKAKGKIIKPRTVTMYSREALEPMMAIGTPDLRLSWDNHILGAVLSEDDINTLMFPSEGLIGKWIDINNLNWYATHYNTFYTDETIQLLEIKEVGFSQTGKDLIEEFDLQAIVTGVSKQADLVLQAATRSPHFAIAHNILMHGTPFKGGLPLREYLLKYFPYAWIPPGAPIRGKQKERSAEADVRPSGWGGTTLMGSRLILPDDYSGGASNFLALVLATFYRPPRSVERFLFAIFLIVEILFLRWLILYHGPPVALTGAALHFYGVLVAGFVLSHLLFGVIQVLYKRSTLPSHVAIDLLWNLFVISFYVLSAYISVVVNVPMMIGLWLPVLVHVLLDFLRAFRPRSKDPLLRLFRLWNDVAGFVRSLRKPLLIRSLEKIKPGAPVFIPIRADLGKKTFIADLEAFRKFRTTIEYDEKLKHLAKNIIVHYYPSPEERLKDAFVPQELRDLAGDAVLLTGAKSDYVDDMVGLTAEALKSRRYAGARYQGLREKMNALLPLCLFEWEKNDPEVLSRISTLDGGSGEKFILASTALSGFKTRSKILEARAGYLNLLLGILSDSRDPGSVAEKLKKWTVFLRYA